MQISKYTVHFWAIRGITNLNSFGRGTFYTYVGILTTLGEEHAIRVQQRFEYEYGYSAEVRELW